MIKNPKTLVDTGFNVATMAAFAMPGGPGIAAGLAGAQALFDIFFQVPDRSDPGSAVASKNDLKNSVSEIKQFIVDADFHAQLDLYSATIVTLNDQLTEVWNDNSSLKPIAKRGPLSHGQFSGSQIKSWKTEIAGYAKPILDAPSPLLTIINWIEGEKAYANQTLGLYLYAGSIWNIYCRLNIAFEYNMALFDYKNAMDDYNNRLITFQTAHSAWKFGDKATRGPEPPAPVAPVKPENDSAFLNGSIYAGKVIQYVGRFIAYAEPKITQLETRFKARESEFNQRLAQVSLKQNANGDWYYRDAGDNKDSSTESSQAIANMQMQMYIGSLRAAAWDRITNKYSLQGVQDAQIQTMKKTIAEFKKAQKSYAPN